MACTCTEDKEVVGNVIIGKNKVTCQECLDAQALQDKAERKREKQAKLQALELKNLRKLFDGEDLTAANAERLQLRTEIQGL